MIQTILATPESHKWSADNIAFGMGGELLQNMSRDTYSFAMKMSAVNRDGVWHNVQKMPKDAPEKASKKGKQDKGMEVVWQDGHLLIDRTFDEIKEKVNG